MTEITPKQDALSKAASLLKQKSETARTTGQTSAFSAILAEQLGSGPLDAAGEADPSGGLPEITASLPAGLAQAGEAPNDFAKEITDTLDLLDTYAQWLADPGKTLRQAYDLLEEIHGGVQDLASRSETGADGPIQGILNHLSTLVAVERIKMDRGDYT